MSPQLSATLLASLCSLNLAGDPPATKRPLQLSLEAMDKTVKQGQVPRFKLTCRNRGSSPDRILDLGDGRRSDLQDTYYDLEVTKEGKAVNIPRAISDPGFITDKDFLMLKPGQKVTFQFTRFAAALERLPPGTYQARIRFWQDPLQEATTAFHSPYAEFMVER